NGVGDVSYPLGTLTNPDRSKYLVLQSIDCCGSIGIFKTHIDPRAISSWPEPMRQRPRVDGGHLLKTVGAKKFHRVETPDRGQSHQQLTAFAGRDALGNRAHVRPAVRLLQTPSVFLIDVRAR